ncbi:MAG: preprotein translocase subunit SecG [Desulfovibrio sp.]|nr:preprotein translocase subunit SecG [Desulfovibrio sp.]
MQSLILTLHIVVCVLLVILILLQSGKEGMGVIFGGGNSSVFGSTGAGGILVKLTTLMALIFVVTSLSYTYVTSSHTEKESTILDVQIESPAKPQDAAGAAAVPAEPKPEPAAVSPAKPDAAASPAPASQGKAQETPLGAPSDKQPSAPEKAGSK